MLPMVNYINGKIYKIICGSCDKIYIGSTTQDLNERMRTHRHRAKVDHARLYKHMRDHGICNHTIELIEDCPCDSLQELSHREAQIQIEHKDKLLNMRSARFGTFEMTGQENKNAIQKIAYEYDKRLYNKQNYYKNQYFIRHIFEYVERKIFQMRFYKNMMT